MLRKDTKLRFWCQKVLPLVYDDSLSYYELLNKVVLHLNQHTEDINALIDFYDTFTEDVEEIIRQMMDDGDFNEIVADTIGSLIAEEYDPENQYIIFDYCIYNSKLYRANGSTTGEFDPEKWDERSVGYDLTTIQNYIYSLNAGNVSFDDDETYDAGTVGKEIKDLKENLNDIDAGEVEYDPTETYPSGTVGNKIKNLNANDVAYNSIETYDNGTVGKELYGLQKEITSHVQTTLTADRAYAVGEYLVYNGRLYRVASNIANGDTIIIGTNVTETYLDNELQQAMNFPIYQTGGVLVEITDSTFGYIDTGISASDYLLLAVHMWLQSNASVRISDIQNGNYRIQVLNSSTGEIVTSGSCRPYYFYMRRSDLTSRTI